MVKKSVLDKERGFVYVMSNPSFTNNLLKIGMSSRDPSTFRAKELETTGVPTPFDVEYVAFAKGYRSLEKKIHKALEQHRPNKNREFFDISLLDAVINIKSLIAPFLVFDECNSISSEDILKKTDIVTYYDNGNIKTQYRYNNALKHGSCRDFHINGQLKIKQGFSLGLRNGIYLEYRKDGTTLTRGYHFHDMKQGQWHYYYKDREEIRYYEDNRPVLTSKMIIGANTVDLKPHGQPSEYYRLKKYSGTTDYLRVAKELYGFKV
jgi:hypothetical protein